MGRPSLAKQRKSEILEAFGRCVARYGLEGSSLEKIAEEAGMKRSILRHYIGNRDELIEELAQKVIGDYEQWMNQCLESLTERTRKSGLIDILLPKTSMGSTEQLMIIENLIGAAPAYPLIRKLVLDYVDGFVDQIANQVQLIAPHLTSKAAWDKAYALVCISFNQESLQPLNLPPKYLRSARTSARQILDSSLA